MSDLASTKRDVISLEYTPRKWQKAAQDGLVGKRYGCWITSRQIGKTVAAVAVLCSRALSGPAHSASCYICPAQSQARRISWPLIKERLRPLGNRVKFLEGQLMVTLPGDRKIYLLGAEAGDNVRGSSFHTIVCDERDSISDEFWSEVMLPTTSAWGDQAFTLFIGTLSGGDSSLWRMYMEHMNDPEWSCVRVPASKSGCFDDAWLAKQRVLLGEMAYLREMEADPKAPVENSVLGRNIQHVIDSGNVKMLPYKMGAEVHVSFDLGIRDFTTAWLFCVVGRYIEVMAYEEFAGIGLTEVMGRILSDKRFTTYRWGTAILPHDAKNRDKLSAVSVADAFYDHWPGVVDVQQSAPNPIATLQSARVNMSRCVFDEQKCDKGIMRLKSARYNVQKKTGTVLDTILHDDNSHCIDAWRLGMYYIESMHPASATVDYTTWNQGQDEASHGVAPSYFE